MDYKQLKDMLDAYPSQRIGKFPNSYKAFTKTGNTQSLFDMLTEDGFFSLHTSNQKKEIVYYHQIIAFYFSGGKEILQNGGSIHMDHHEIHHLNGNTFDNSPDNLQYLPIEVHNLITSFQRTIERSIRNRKKAKKLISMIKQGKLIIWNRKGQQVKRIKEWIVNLISKTIVLTAKFFYIPLSLKGLLGFLRSLLKNLLGNINPNNLTPLFLKEYTLT